MALQSNVSVIVLNNDFFLPNTFGLLAFFKQIKNI